MAKYKISTPSDPALYPLRIHHTSLSEDTEVSKGEILATLELADGRKVRMPCPVGGALREAPEIGRIYAKRGEIALIEHLEDVTSSSEDSPQAASGLAAASSTADSDWKAERPSWQAAAEDAEAMPEEGHDAATSAKDAAFAGGARPGRLIVRGALALAALAAVLFLASPSGFSPSGDTALARASGGVSASSAWMNAPALAAPASFRLVSRDGAEFFGVDVDDQGNALIAGRIGNNAIICSYNFGLKSKDCSPQIHMPSNEIEGLFSAEDFANEGARERLSKLLPEGMEKLYKSSSYPGFGFVLQHAFPGGDALVGFTSPSNTELTVFYRYDKANRNFTRIDPIGIEARYTKIARSPNYIALFGDEPQDDDRQALAIFDQAGNGESVHIARTWNPFSKGRSGPQIGDQTRTFTHVALTENEGGLSQVELTGRTAPNLGAKRGIRTRISLEDRGSDLKLGTKVSTKTFDAENMLPEKGRAAYLREDFILTARAYNPASGATATSAGLITRQASASSGDKSGAVRKDILITIESAAGKILGRLLMAGGDFPYGTEVSRIVPLANGRFALLIGSRQSGKQFSAIMLIDEKGTPLRQERSDTIVIRDLVAGQNGSLYAVGYTKEDGTRYGVLRHYQLSDL